MQKQWGKNRAHRAIALAVAAVLTLGLCAGMPGGVAMAAYEGPGEQAPEDAAQAFLIAMRDEDVQGAIAAFAIERYMAQYDLEQALQTYMVYPASKDGLFPATTPMLAAFGVELRHTQVVDEIIGLFTLFHAYDQMENGGAFTGGYVTFKGDDMNAQITAFADAFAASVAKLKTIEVTGFVPPETLSEVYGSARNLENMARIGKARGAEEYRSVVARFTIAGEPFLLLCDVARYGDAWYMVTTHGNIGSLLGVGAQIGAVPESAFQ